MVREEQSLPRECYLKSQLHTYVKDDCPPINPRVKASRDGCHMCGKFGNQFGTKLGARWCYLVRLLAAKSPCKGGCKLPP